jgi:hypothetical protein
MMPDTSEARCATRGAASPSGSRINVTSQPGTNPLLRDFQMVARACVEAPRSPHLWRTASANSSPSGRWFEALIFWSRASRVH